MSFYSLIISKFSYELLYLKAKYTRNKTKSINDKDAEAYPITKVYIHFKYILFWKHNEATLYNLFKNRNIENDKLWQKESMKHGNVYYINIVILSQYTAIVVHQSFELGKNKQEIIN